MAGQGTTQIAILGAIGKGFKTLDELDTHLPIVRSEISKAASKLIEKLLIERLERGRFQLTGEGRDFLNEGRSITSGPNKPRHMLAKQPSNTLRQRAWNAMRFQGRFTVPSICMVAKTAKDKAPEHNLQTYFRLLLNACYLVGSEMCIRDRSCRARLSRERYGRNFQRLQSLSADKEYRAVCASLVERQDD